MNHPSKQQRPRGPRNPNAGIKSRPFSGGGRNQVFDSNGPDGRIRGNAHQVMERYLALARDASSQGDRVSAENFYQHAEHYFRLLNAFNQNNGQKRLPSSPTPAEDQPDIDGMEDEEYEDGPIGDGSDSGSNPAPESMGA